MYRARREVLTPSGQSSPFFLVHPDLAATPGQFGGNGGYGTSWSADPTEDMVGILMTQRALTSPILPNVVFDFWASAYQAIDD